MRLAFRNQWQEDRLVNGKLGFYNSIKGGFSCESYINSKISAQQCRRIAQLRSSAHRLRIETGRHGSAKASNIINRLCERCCTTDRDVLTFLAEMPFFDPIIEDELYVLRTCISYEDLRHQLSDEAKISIFTDLSRLFNEPLLSETASFLTKIFRRRFPKKSPIKQA